MHLILTRVTPPCLFHVKDLLNNLSVHIFYVRVQVATKYFLQKRGLCRKGIDFVQRDAYKSSVFCKFKIQDVLECSHLRGDLKFWIPVYVYPNLIPVKWFRLWYIHLHIASFQALFSAELKPNGYNLEHVISTNMRQVYVLDN